jgi:hypothetical protein
MPIKFLEMQNNSFSALILPQIPIIPAPIPLNPDSTASKIPN